MPVPSLEDSIRQVTIWVNGLPSKSRLLSEIELSRYDGDEEFVAGWRLSVQLSELVDIGILIPRSFPFKPPEYALFDDRSAGWPHCKDDGRLCAYPSTIEISAYMPAQVVEELFHDVVGLVQELLDGKLTSDFEDEFETYWFNKSTPGCPINYSLLEPDAPVGEIKVWHGKKFCLIGSGEEVLSQWLGNHGVRQENQRFSDAFFCRIPSPLLPNEYPKRSSEIFEIIRTHCSKNYDQFLDLVAKNDGQLTIVIGSNTKTGPCFAAMQMRRTISSFRQQVPGHLPGFRPGKAPATFVCEALCNKFSSITGGNQKSGWRVGAWSGHGRSILGFAKAENLFGLEMERSVRLSQTTSRRWA